jgi:hypothetical protein
MALKQEPLRSPALIVSRILIFGKNGKPFQSYAVQCIPTVSQASIFQLV